MRNEGIPVSDQELVSGLRSIAVRIRSRSGDVVAAISLAVHRLVVSMEQLRADFGGAADEISTRVGTRYG